MKQAFVELALRLVPRFVQKRALVYAARHLIPSENLPWYQDKVLKVQLVGSTHHWSLHYDGVVFTPSDSAPNVLISLTLDDAIDRVQRVLSRLAKKVSIKQFLRWTKHLLAKRLLMPFRYAHCYRALRRSQAFSALTPYSGEKYHRYIMLVLRYRDFALISLSPKFNLDYYNLMVGQRFQSRDEAIVHFTLYGKALCVDPTPEFSRFRYLCRHPDLHNMILLPFSHYLRFGEKEGRTIE
ncbi:hypothetical protein [Vibrio astriarenae]|uniref:hypothetical protein n=1 Tax=Vibrio astriarenae TaxID=1481923 RepID=UPI0037363FA4